MYGVGRMVVATLERNLFDIWIGNYDTLSMISRPCLAPLYDMKRVPLPIFTANSTHVPWRIASPNCTFLRFLPGRLFVAIVHFGGSYLDTFLYNYARMNCGLALWIDELVYWWCTVNPELRTYACICSYNHTYTHTHTYTDTYMHACIRTYFFTYLRTYTHT